MTDQQIENLYWTTTQRFSAMANHAAVIVAFAREIEKAARQEPYLDWPTLDPIAPTPSDRQGFEPREYCERN